MVAILRPPTLRGTPDEDQENANYAVEIHNAILQLDQKQQQLDKTLKSVQTAMAPATATAAPAPVAAPSGHVVSSFSIVGPPTSALIWIITHNLGTTNVLVQIRRVSNGQLVTPNVHVIDANAIRVIVPGGSTNAFVAVIHG